MDRSIICRRFRNVTIENAVKLAGMLKEMWRIAFIGQNRDDPANARLHSPSTIDIHLSNMFWKNLSIGKKLFIAILTTSGIIILFLAALIATSMQAGFSQYILEAELDRFEPVRITLEQMHDPANPGWPQLQNNRRGLNQLIRQSLPRPAPPATASGGQQSAQATT